ncbi:TspO/MBR family-domain-containing protein [Mariannaea sp. PMI_226]|nr:TspO/MBR family-domain-containing protein [Mariannaea sp. PMI_226]
MTTFIPSLTLPSAVFLNPAVSVLLPIGLGIASGLSATQTQDTYLSLKKPKFYPPPWVFGPVWTVLYGLMGYTAYRATFNGLSPLNSPETLKAAHHGMTLYTIQLGLNLIWTPLFFGFNRPIMATVDIISLLGVNGYLTYVWSTVDPVASLCQIPYLAWLTFATYLCTTISSLNNWDLASNAAREQSKKQQ